MKRTSVLFVILTVMNLTALIIAFRSGWRDIAWYAYGSIVQSAILGAIANAQIREARAEAATKARRRRIDLELDANGWRVAHSVALEVPNGNASKIEFNGVVESVTWDMELVRPFEQEVPNAFAPNPPSSRSVMVLRIRPIEGPDVDDIALWRYQANP